jgi:hypothetical protein
MRCSECSNTIKPLVAIDIDGTLGDYHTHFLRFADAYLGDTIPFVSPSYAGQCSFKEWFMTGYGCDESTWQTIKLAYRQGAQKRSMPSYPDAQWLVNNLRWDNVEVWLTTTRPYLRLDGVDPDTRAWLDRIGIEYDGLLYDEDKYHVLGERIDPDRVVAVLDDLPEMYDAAAQVFGKDIPILAKQDYNADTTRPNEAESLGAALGMIQDRLESWYGKFSN